MKSGAHARGELRDVRIGEAQRHGVREQCRNAGLAQRLGTEREALLRRQAVGLGDDGDGLVTASRRGQDASDQPVELIVVEQMGLLGQLGQRHDVFRNLEKQGKDLIPMHEGRIGLREQLSRVGRCFSSIASFSV